MAYRVAIHRTFSRGEFVRECIIHPKRKLETTNEIGAAKPDFIDQADVDGYVTARGGVAGEWLVLDLSAAGVC